MTGTLKWIFFAMLFVILGGLVLTQTQSCRNQKATDPLLENATSGMKEISEELDTNLDDLYENGADKLSDLEKEAIKAKDKVATEAQDLSNDIFESEEDDVEGIDKDTDLLNNIREANDRQTTQKTTNYATGSDRIKGNKTGGDYSEKYFVVVGSFLKKSNADELRKSLVKSGYDEAEVAVFDFSQYFSVFAKRTNDLNSAQETAAAIKRKLGHKAYVHTKRSKYQKR